MSNFAFAIEQTLEAEGGDRFSDHPADRGGKTRWGISERLARRHDYKGDMRELPRAFAVRVAELEFWNPLRLDEIASRYIAAEVFDTAFNSGPADAVRILQEVLGWLSAPVQVDSHMGPITLGATNSLLPAKEASPRNALAVRRGMHYVRIVEKDPSQAVFLAGWMARLFRSPKVASE